MLAFSRCWKRLLGLGKDFFQYSFKAIFYLLRHRRKNFKTNQVGEEGTKHLDSHTHKHKHTQSNEEALSLSHPYTHMHTPTHTHTRTPTHETNDLFVAWELIIQVK